MITLIIYLISYILTYYLARYCFKRDFEQWNWNNIIAVSIASLLPIITLPFFIVIFFVCGNYSKLPKPPKWL